MYFIHLLLNILFVTLSSGHLLSQVHHLNVEKLFFNKAVLNQRWVKLSEVGKFSIFWVSVL